MAFSGRGRIRNRRVTNNKAIEQIYRHIYLVLPQSYKRQKRSDTKLTRILEITGINNHALKPSKVQKAAGLRIYSLAAATLSPGGEIWTL
jgi:hypothetical protein